MRLYVQLCRLGDILNLLPLLYEDAQKGNRSSLMVCHEYIHHLDGCSYLDALDFDGGRYDLLTAVDKAKMVSDDVKVCQVTGPRDTVLEHVYKANGITSTVTDSFQQESWRLAGRGQSDWLRQPPLIFDKRNKEREAALLKSVGARKKMLLVAPTGYSSPFPCTPLLLDLLQMKFCRRYDVVNLGDVKAERIYDLLGLYERAVALVSVDSAPLHLAHAVPKLPVIALVKDTPNYWHGSAWRPQHLAYIRYGDFPARHRDMFDAIDNIGKAGSYL